MCEARVIEPDRAITFTEAEVFAAGGDGARAGERLLVMKASATMALVEAARTRNAKARDEWF